jgi:hypothetical protein
VTAEAREPCTNEQPADLVGRLQEAALAAIANERNDLSYRPEQIRSLTIEFELANGGAVIDVLAYVGRKYVHRRRG